MSRWSSTVALSLFLMGSPVIGQVPEPVSVLLTAPAFRRGIEWLSANVIPHWFATYRTSSDEADLQMEVLYIEGRVEEAGAWEATVCQSRRILASGNGNYYHESPDGWSLLVTLTSGAETPPATPCDFVDLFVPRFQFFQTLQLLSSNSGSSLDSLSYSPEFPAILTRSQ